MSRRNKLARCAAELPINCVAALFVIVFVLGSERGQAASVTWAYRGTVTAVSDFLNGIPSPLGERATLDFTFDTNATDINPLSSVGVYRMSGEAASFGVQIARNARTGCKLRE